MTVYVCFDKDMVCGDNHASWCLGCPKRGLLQVAVAPHAAAHAGPTVMRAATPEEHGWLRNAAMRASKLVPHPDTKRLDWLEQQQDVTWQDHTGHWSGCDGGTLRAVIDAHRERAEGAIVADSETMVLAIREHLDGWASATFGWQDDPDPATAERNKQRAIQAHAAECLRRIRATLGAGAAA